MAQLVFDPAQTPASIAEIVSDDFRILHARSCCSAKNLFGSIAAFTCSPLLELTRRRFFRSADRREACPTSDSSGGRRNAREGRQGVSRLFRVAQWPGRVRRSMRRSLPDWLHSPYLPPRFLRQA